MIRVMILGSKEYPFGSNSGDDPIPSGGMETYVSDIAPELSKYCSLLIITRRFRGLAEREEAGPNIEVIRVPWIRGRWLRNPSFNFFSFLAALKNIRDADIIYSNGVVSGIAGLLLGKVFRKKTVYRPAGMGFLQYRLPLKSILYLSEGIVTKKSDAVVFHSAGEMKNFRRLLGFNPDRGHVILTGFPVERFKSGSNRLRDALSPDEQVVICSVSRLVPVKGLETLLEACSMLNHDFRLALVGSGPEEMTLRGLAKEYGIAEKVIFMGFRLDVPDILAASDIFVVSSLSEGLPTSLLEAMAAQNACVVTDIGLPVEHMKTGVVVEPGNPEALKDALGILIKNSGLREQLGMNAKRFVEENCTQEIAAKKHMDMFTGLVSS